MRRTVLFAMILSMCFLSAARAAVTLPQDHQYQRGLRKFMGTLVEKDFEPERKEFMVVPPGEDKDALLRMWILALAREPRIGRKRSAPSVNLPAGQFLLSAIEGPEAVINPWVWPEPLAWFASWDYAGNPYGNSRALKLRAFVTAAVDMMMTDRRQETEPEKGGNRSDYLAPHLVMYSYTYLRVKNVLPREARDAYEAGLRKMCARLIAWGPKGEEVHFELLSAVGLWYACEALDDDGFTEAVDAYVRPLFTDERWFHPAGYFVDNGCYDASFNGMSRYFATWFAIASGREFARKAVEKACRLRAHMMLPEPDGNIFGPSHFSSRTGSDARNEQWEWAFRYWAEAMLTDESIHLTPLPPDEDLAGAARRKAGEYRAQLRENPGYKPSKELKSRPWKFSVWANTWAFPMTNFAEDHYREGLYDRLAKLKAENSPLLKMPFQREGDFVRAFEGAFVVAKLGEMGVIVHTGPVSGPAGKGYYEFPGYYGFGGGALSAFWTPKTGSVILGRRRGMAYEKNMDKLEEWRSWPTHAVSGVKTDGKVFTSARIRRPEAEYGIGKDEAEVRVGAVIPQADRLQGKVLEGMVDYTRRFRINAGGLRVETSVQGYIQDKVAELYEVLPVFLREAGRQSKVEPTRIEFEVDGKWTPATAEFQDKVTAARLTRFDGQVLTKFARPRRVKLSPEDWQDTYLSRAACRNILIDLLETGGEPAILREASVAYEIAPVWE